MEPRVTAARWAEMVREDQNQIPEGLSAARIDTDDFLYVEWRGAAAIEGDRYSRALRAGAEIKHQMFARIRMHPDNPQALARSGRRGHLWSGEREDGLPEGWINNT